MTREIRVLPLAALAATLVMAAPASAEEASKPDLSKWVKVCEAEGGKQTCTVMQRIIGPDGELVSSLSIRQVAGERDVDWVISMPLGVNIKDGLVARIDDQKPIPLDYTTCTADACYVQVVSNETLVNAMKAGGTLRLTAETAGRSVTLPVTLMGFTKAHDGEGVDPEAAAAHFEKLDEAAVKDIAARQAQLAAQQQTAAPAAQ
jgi:invasion protein IalB